MPLRHNDDVIGKVIYMSWLNMDLIDYFQLEFRFLIHQ